MHRVELKAKLCGSPLGKLSGSFLMHRVELKVRIRVGLKAFLSSFLMHLVELKENLVYN